VTIQGARSTIVAVWPSLFVLVPKICADPVASPSPSPSPSAPGEFLARD